MEVENSQIEESVRLELKKFVLVNNKYPSADTLLKRTRGMKKKEIELLLNQVQTEYPNFTNFLLKCKEETKKLQKRGNTSLIEIVDILVEGNEKISRYSIDGFSVKEGTIVLVNYHGNNLEGVVVSEPYFVYRDYVSYEYKPIKEVIGNQNLKRKTVDEIIEFISTYLLLHKNFDKINKSKEYSECANKIDIEKAITNLKTKYPSLEKYITKYRMKMLEEYQKDSNNYIKLMDVKKTYKNKVVLKPYRVGKENYHVEEVVITTPFEEKGKIVSEPYYALKKYGNEFTQLKKSLNRSDIDTNYAYRLEIRASMKNNQIEVFDNENKQIGLKKLVMAFEEMFDFYNQFYSGENNNTVVGFYNVDFYLENELYIVLEFSMDQKLESTENILSDIGNTLNNINLDELSSQIITIDNPNEKIIFDHV